MKNHRFLPLVYLSSSDFLVFYLVIPVTQRFVSSSNFETISGLSNGSFAEKHRMKSLPIVIILDLRSLFSLLPHLWSHWTLARFSRTSTKMSGRFSDCRSNRSYNKPYDCLNADFQSSTRPGSEGEKNRIVSISARNFPPCTSEIRWSSKLWWRFAAQSSSVAARTMMKSAPQLCCRSASSSLSGLFCCSFSCSTSWHVAAESW